MCTNFWFFCMLLDLIVCEIGLKAKDGFYRAVSETLRASVEVKMSKGKNVFEQICNKH